MQTYPCGENAEWLTCLLLHILLAVKYEVTWVLIHIFFINKIETSIDQ